MKDFNEITKKLDAVRSCTSEGYECEKIAIEKIKHFVSKEALNIDGFGKKIVENFWKIKLIKLPHDIFKLDYEKIKKLEGWGKLSVSNLKYSIDSKKSISLDKFIFSLGGRRGHGLGVRQRRGGGGEWRRCCCGLLHHPPCATSPRPARGRLAPPRRGGGG